MGSLECIVVEQVMRDNAASMVTIENEIEKAFEYIIEITRPTPKIHFRLSHLEE